MPIYDRPTKALLREFAEQQLKPGEIFEKQRAVAWFATKYPKIKPATVQMHVEAMSVNSNLRQHHPSVRPNSGHDVFYKIAPGRFRLWDKNTDPAPRYGSDATIKRDETEDAASGADPEPDTQSATEFAFERDLRNYLEKNLPALEQGLKLFDDEGLRGVEFPAGSGRIDILAVAADGALVVIELKVSRGYDRVIGQIMRYMAWVKQNIAESRSVRGIIVASEVSEELKLAASLIADVRLVEYELSFSLKPVD